MEIEEDEFGKAFNVKDVRENLLEMEEELAIRISKGYYLLIPPAKWIDVAIDVADDAVPQTEEFYGITKVEMRKPSSVEIVELSTELGNGGIDYVTEETASSDPARSNVISMLIVEDSCEFLGEENEQDVLESKQLDSKQSVSLPNWHQAFEEAKLICADNANAKIVLQNFLPVVTILRMQYVLEGLLQPKWTK